MSLEALHSTLSFTFDARTLPPILGNGPIVNSPEQNPNNHHFIRLIYTLRAFSIPYFIITNPLFLESPSSHVVVFIVLLHLFRSSCPRSSPQYQMCSKVTIPFIPHLKTAPSSHSFPIYFLEGRFVFLLCSVLPMF